MLLYMHPYIFSFTEEKKISLELIYNIGSISQDVNLFVEKRKILLLSFINTKQSRKIY